MATPEQASANLLGDGHIPCDPLPGASAYYLTHKYTSEPPMTVNTWVNPSQLKLDQIPNLQNCEQSNNSI